MLPRLVFSSLLLLAFSFTASACLYKRADVPFTYTGETGPILWHSLTPAYSKCATGKQQSPVDVTSLFPHAENTTLLYPSAAGFEIENNGHTIQLTPKKELLAVLNGRTFKLLQFHFHVPSEHRLEDEFFPMEVHFVHQDVETGKLAVIGIFFELTEAVGDPVLCAMYPFLDSISSPKKDKKPYLLVPLDSVVNVVRKSPIRTYDGSLTTPPCDESVSWFVVEKPLDVTVSQFNKMKKIMKFNARYTQNDHYHRKADNLLELSKERFPSKPGKH